MALNRMPGTVGLFSGFKKVRSLLFLKNSSTFMAIIFREMTIDASCLSQRLIFIKIFK